MTISAEAGAREGDRLERALDLYRELTLQLQRAIADLKAKAEDKDRAKDQVDLVRLHQKSLVQVLDIEASLGKRSKAAGGGVELDLDAARAEIHARLARWVVER